MRADDGIGWQATRQTSAQESIPYFDSVAGEYLGRYSDDSPAGYALRTRKARLLELLAGAGGRVLDVGCGPGVIVQEVLDLGCDLWGVDGSPRMIAKCREAFGRSPRAHFSVGNAMALPFADGTFDLVMCMGVIDRLAQPELAIRELARVLRPNGTFFMSFPNLLSPYALWRSHVFYPMVGCLKRILRTAGRRRPLPDLASAARLWTPGASSRTVRRIVGDVTDVAYYNFGLLLSPLDELAPRAALCVARRLEWVRGGRLRWLGAGFILKARKRG